MGSLIFSGTQNYIRVLSGVIPELDFLKKAFFCKNEENRYLRNEKMKKPHFLHVDTNSLKLKVDQKVLGLAWSLMIVPTLVAKI